MSWHGIAFESKDLRRQRQRISTRQDSRASTQIIAVLMFADGHFEPEDWQLHIEIIAAAARAITQKHDAQTLPHHTQIIAVLMFAVRSC